MRPTFAGPGSSTSHWKPTQDPGKTSPCSNTGGNKSSGVSGSSLSSKGANPQQQQNTNDQEEKE